MEEINEKEVTLLESWIDKLIYGWEDTLPNEGEDPECYISMMNEIIELYELKELTNKLKRTFND